MRLDGCHRTGLAKGAGGEAYLYRVGVSGERRAGQTRHYAAKWIRTHKAAMGPLPLGAGLAIVLPLK